MRQSILFLMLLAGCTVEVEADPDRGALDGAVIDGAINDGAPPDVVPIDADIPDRAAPPDEAVEPDAAPGCGAEICNGLDDDCDGQVDEQFGVGSACRAGRGACARDGERVCGPDGTSTCTARADAPQPEACNGLDDDCDDQIDEGLGLQAECVVGVGFCRRGGQQICGPDGAPTCSATPGAGRDEACNAIDDDCDGTTDEGLLNACGDCGPLPDERCNGVDDDCDGTTDEGLLNVCGDCGPDPIEMCNGVDDDCDGALDEGLGGDPCVSGQGICARDGVTRCDGRGIVCAAAPGPAGDEICGNGLDDDCDGGVDEPPLAACEQQVGRCDLPVAWACADGAWACPPWDAPIPPQCAPIDCEAAPHIVLGNGATGAAWFLAPTAEDPAPAAVWPTGGGFIVQRLDAATEPLGAPVPIVGRLHGLVRDGAGFASVLADDEGFRWVHIAADGAIARRGPLIYARHGEILPAEELNGADLLPVDGGFVVALTAWASDRLAFHTALVDGDGAVVEARAVGGVAQQPRLVASPAGRLVVTTTRNGVGFGGRAFGGLPLVAAVAPIDARGQVGAADGTAGIVHALQAVPTPRGRLTVFSAGQRINGVHVTPPGGPTHTYVAGVSVAFAATWADDRGLLVWSAVTPAETVGLRVQPIDHTGARQAPAFWLATDVEVRALHIAPVGDAIVTTWIDRAGVVRAIRGTTPRRCADLQCAPGAWPIPPDRACSGLVECQDPADCVPEGPVCGCDGEDYPDRCAAMRVGVGVWRFGACPDTFFPCDDGTWDRNGDGPEICRPCTAFGPVCGWRPGQHQEQGRIYPDLCAAQASVPDLGANWTEGTCQLPAQLDRGCDPALCDQACPICGVDQQCYSWVDIWGDSVCR